MPEPIIAFIVAVAENGVIGRGGQLPWRMPSDLKTFRRLTMGKPMIMGRRTFASIGRPLDGRDNIVVTRDPGFAPAGVIVASNIDAAIADGQRCAAARSASEIMVIGGAEIFDAVLPRAGRIYLTRVHARPQGDVTFPDPDPRAWTLVSSAPIPPDPRDDHAATLLIYERIN